MAKNEKNQESKNEETKVSLFIPKDPINKNNHVWVMVNGEEYYLATGKKLKVPEHIAEAYHNSYEATQEAYDRIDSNNEIK